MNNEATWAKLAPFTALLARWSSRINLVGRDEDLVQRHVEDSLQLQPFVGEGSHIDVGAGAGFPGLVLALATARHFHLVEADRRKAAFLEEAIRITGAPATVHRLRVETFQHEPADLLTARAFAPLDRLLALTTHLIGPQTRLALLKGRSVAEELETARSRWQFDADLTPSALPGNGSVLVLHHVRPRSHQRASL